MKILVLGDFRRDSPHFMLNNPRMFSKGFVRNGHDVLEFSYRERLLRHSPFKSKKLAVALAKKKTDRLLVQLARHHQSDIVFITAFKLLDGETIMQIKEALPAAMIICWYSDPPKDINPTVTDIALQCDWFLSTSGAEVLQLYKSLNVPHCAFMPNPCDPDLQHPVTVSPKWRSQLLFIGKLKHNRAGQDSLRWELIKFLVEKKAMTVWGALEKPAVKGRDYINAISGAEMALSINVYNDVRFYHSDRLTHFMSCGAFVLAKHVPDSDLLFEDGRHICYFKSLEHCLELIDRFETEKARRQEIAAAGMKHAHETFNCVKLASHIIDLATKGDYKATWREIV